MRTSIVVSLRVEGIHCWPDCDIAEVSFLRDPHRHVFHIKAKKPVTHADRDIEIIMLKREIQTFLSHTFGPTCNFESMSCEHIAQKLVRVFELSYCEVLEDGENGAEVYA